MYSSRCCVGNRCVSTPAKKGSMWSHVPWTAGQGLFLFLLCTYMFYNLPVSRFGYRQTEMKHNKFKTNKLTTAASQDQSQKSQEYVLSNLPVSGIQANGNEAHQIQNKQVDNSSLDQTKPKTTNLQKRVSCGMVLMASTMLHEKCCNTVL